MNRGERRTLLTQSRESRPVRKNDAPAKGNDTNRTSFHTTPVEEMELERDSDDQYHPSRVYISQYTKESCLCGVVASVCVLLIIGLTFGGGILVGKGLHELKENWGEAVSIGGQSVPVLDWFDGELNVENIKNNLETLTAKPHIAGSEENQQLAVMIYKQWEAFSFDKVELVNYSVLLSYPNTRNPNRVQLKNSGGAVLYEAHTQQEPPLTPGENDSTVAPPFNAYSGSGSVSGSLVYVNYARIEDFLYLTTNLSLELSNHVCISRYGKIFRGDKAHLAQRYNCSALLIFSDPQDYAPEGVPVYPNGPSLPPGGIQRGSLNIMPGDPLTPDLPSISGIYRQPYSEVVDEEIVPHIPVQPISYGDAVHFMSITRVEVNNYQEQRAIHNVIATIYGRVEPDRQVILGNHRDAWVFGAVDPNSGTAVLMELARSLSVLRANSWRPGRTLVLCSWDAEEYGLIGSTEWVEDKGKLLGANTVAYLNVDVAVEGSQSFATSANPLLYGAVWKAAEMVKCPDPGFNTVYDQWLHFSSKDYNGTAKPLIGELGSGSDFTMFLQALGVSCTSSTYVNTTDYAVYHSVHDNFYWMSHFGDPNFSHHLALGLVWIKTAMLLTTIPVLPYDPRDYALTLTDIFKSVNKQYGDTLSEQGISLDYLAGAVSEFSDGCVGLWEEVQRVSGQTDLSENTVRIINDKFMNIERAFIHPEGLPGRPYFKHVIFAPSSVNSYGSSLFPGISDTIFTATQSGSQDDWNKVRRQIDIVRNHLRYATMIMNEPTLKFAP